MISPFHTAAHDCFYLRIIPSFCAFSVLAAYISFHVSKARWLWKFELIKIQNIFFEFFYIYYVGVTLAW